MNDSMAKPKVVIKKRKESPKAKPYAVEPWLFSLSRYFYIVHISAVWTSASSMLYVDVSFP